MFTHSFQIQKILHLRHLAKITDQVLLSSSARAYQSHCRHPPVLGQSLREQRSWTGPCIFHSRPDARYLIAPMHGPLKLSVDWLQSISLECKDRYSVLLRSASWWRMNDLFDYRLLLSASQNRDWMTSSTADYFSLPLILFMTCYEAF